MKKILICLSIAVFSALVLVAVVAYKFYSPDGITSGSEYVLIIDSSDTPESVAGKLKTAGLIQNPRLLSLLFELKSYCPSRHPGRYVIEGKGSWVSLADRLRIGEQTPVQLVFNTMRTVEDLCSTVSLYIDVDSSELHSLLYDSLYIASLGFNMQTIPAMFIPNTYNMWWTSTPEEFLERMKKEYERYWNTERKMKAEQLGLTPLEVSVLASVIDEESACVKEYPIIAGVYLNRLSRGMKLDADPTLKFAAGDFTMRRVLDVHKDIDSPYNTYMYGGLPPGPIRIPSLQAIEAVLAPAKHQYLYFCANSDFSGTHIFSRTINEHNRHANEYRRALDKRRILK